MMDNVLQRRMFARGRGADDVLQRRMFREGGGVNDYISRSIRWPKASYKKDTPSDIKDAWMSKMRSRTRASDEDINAAWNAGARSVESVAAFVRTNFPRKALKERKAMLALEEYRQNKRNEREYQDVMDLGYVPDVETYDKAKKIEVDKRNARDWEKTLVEAQEDRQRTEQNKQNESYMDFMDSGSGIGSLSPQQQAAPMQVQPSIAQEEAEDFGEATGRMLANAEARGINTSRSRRRYGARQPGLRRPIGEDTGIGSLIPEPIMGPEPQDTYPPSRINVDSGAGQVQKSIARLEEYSQDKLDEKYMDYEERGTPGAGRNSVQTSAEARAMDAKKVIENRRKLDEDPDPDVSDGGGPGEPGFNAYSTRPTVAQRPAASLQSNVGAEPPGQPSGPSRRELLAMGAALMGSQNKYGTRSGLMENIGDALGAANKVGMAEDVVSSKEEIARLGRSARIGAARAKSKSTDKQQLRLAIDIRKEMATGNHSRAGSLPVWARNMTVKGLEKMRDKPTYLEKIIAESSNPGSAVTAPGSAGMAASDKIPTKATRRKPKDAEEFASWPSGTPFIHPNTGENRTKS